MFNYFIQWKNYKKYILIILSNYEDKSFSQKIYLITMINFEKNTL